MQRPTHLRVPLHCHVLAATIIAAACHRVPPSVPNVHDGAAAFRVLQWNVSGPAWTMHADAARAILRHADPDVLVLDEVDSTLGAAGVRRMLAGLRGARDTTWFVSFGASGSYQRTAIASRDTVRDVPEFALVAFPDTGLTIRAAAVPDTVQSHPTRAEAGTIGTNGALVRVHGRWLFVVGMDLTCCGSAGSWRDARRDVEATAIRERMRAFLAHSRPAGVIAAGDMNLATGPAPLDTILTTVAAPPLGPMRAADALHADRWNTWTWDGRGSAFNGGRLDVITYSAGTLQPEIGHVWNTELMSPDTLRVHGLTPGTAASINRHRPVVVDFHFR